MRLLLAAVMVVGAFPSPAADFNSFSVDYQDDRYTVVVDVVLDVPIAPVRKVITDYDHLFWISGAVKKSQHLDNPSKGIHTVYTQSHACILFFCKTIEQVQRVDETDPSRIVFTALPKYSDVKYSRTVWEIDSLEAERTHLVWTFEMEPDFFIPPVIGPSAVKSTLLEKGKESIRNIETLARERMNR